MLTCDIRYKFPANTVTSTLKYLAKFRIICRLNGFFPASTSEIVDFGIPSPDESPPGSSLWRISAT
jgi:hypothetical protein